MDLSISNRALLRGVMASALVLAGTTACSRSDRDQSGRDNTAAVVPDTAAGDAATGTAIDTGTATGGISDTASATAPSNSPRASTATPRSEKDSVPSGNNEAAGYRQMDRDTAATPNEPQDSARVTEDTSETSINTPAQAEPASAADTSSTEVASAGVDTVAADSEMARDTSTTPEQAETVSQAEGDVALRAGLDTTHADADVATDTAMTAEAQVANPTPPSGASDTGESGHIRPPEDSTEVLGNVTSDDTAGEASIDDEDRETVATSEARTDEVGAAALSGDVTGSDAVALMTRQGAQCVVVNPESNAAARWDMSSTPATLNPCGLGSMNLSKVRTAKG
jgi:hypothetical protein